MRSKQDKGIRHSQHKMTLFGFATTMDQEYRDKGIVLLADCLSVMYSTHYDFERMTSPHREHRGAAS